MENLEFVVVEICKFVSICHCEKCEAFHRNLPLRGIASLVFVAIQQRRKVL
ncbi:MAG: hypothetical protein IJ923_04075 [Campylobacter sp.]|nr:hypothetical protein [Campylobacter sp.]